MKKNLLILLFILPLFVHGQLTDNFNDGDFTNNPAWSGDVAKWQVNAGVLQSNSSVASDTFQLSTPSTVAANAQWELFVKLDFSTSGNNWVDVYILSDNADLKASLNGYFVRIGNTADDICLYRRDGNLLTKIIDGVDGRSQPASTNNLFKIKVIRTTANLWTLSDDNTGTGNSYFNEGTINDGTYTSSAFIGFSIKQSTASFFNKHYFDDISVGPIIIDVIPPVISNLTVIDSTQIDVKFSEAVDQTTAETVLNYSVDNSIGNPASAVLDGIDVSLVHLSFANQFSNGILNTLTVTNVQDLSGNIIAPGSSSTFTYSMVVPASVFDVVINEFMADPVPNVALPDSAEYVELFNRSNSTLNLNGWTFSDASTTVTFGNQSLAPHSYLILCSSNYQPAFLPYGTAVGFPSFPSLNNTGGETLTLKNNTGTIIDQVYYDETYYHNSQKADGGWSIERVDPDFTCPNYLNWMASVDNRGGTPGSSNSVSGTFVDNAGPQLLRGIIETSTSVRIFFDEPLKPSTVLPASYSIDNGIGVPFLVSLSSDNMSVQLNVATPFDSSHIYTVSVLSGITDCPGNALSIPASVRVAFPKTVDSLDVIINEVLFHPQSGGSEFVELYNRSSKVLDLKDIFLYDSTASNPFYTISAETNLFFPDNYIVLTKNISDVKSRYTIQNPLAFIQPVSMPTFTDDGDYVGIANVSGKVLDQLVYSQDWQFPLLNTDALAGVSLERLSPSRPTQDQSNWHSAAENAGFATPGYKNSQYDGSQGDGNELSVVPEIFSPDNDGHNDVVDVHYHFENPGNVATVSVYDARGRLIRNLVDNELIGNDGSFVWDGVTNSKDKARVGMYIFYIQVYDVKGDTKNFKKTCVLASKL